MRYTIKSLKETEQLAKEFANKLKPGDVVLLNGDLGAGKTTFTQFVFKFLGVEGVVSSPTFAILKSYQGKYCLHHFDTYRISTEEAIESGFDEVINEKESIKFIEWSDNIAPLLPSFCKTINIKRLGETEREFEIDG